MASSFAMSLSSFLLELDWMVTDAFAGRIVGDNGGVNENSQCLITNFSD
jgi:hypothetical protein